MIGLMHIRRLFYAKLGAVRRQRQKLLQQVPLTEADRSYDASSRLCSISNTAQQLQELSEAELRAHLHVSAFLRLGSEARGGGVSPHAVVL